MVKRQAKEVLDLNKDMGVKGTVYGSGVQQVPTEVTIKKEVDALALPHQAKRLYGCSNCEWKGTKLCPYGFKKNGPASQNTHVNGICKDRENYLLNLSRLDEPRPTFSKWLLGYQKTIATVQNSRDYHKLLEIQDKLDALDQMHDPPTRLLKEARAEEKYYRERWAELSMNIIKYEEMQVARETAKAPLFVGSMSLTQINQLINDSDEEDKKIVREIKGEDKEKNE